MLAATLRRPIWMGGVAMTQGIDTHKHSLINVEASVKQGGLPKDALIDAPQPWKYAKHYHELRADIYEEISKLPLRYALHPFERLQQAASASAVGYFPPLGPAEPIDTVPFFIHRDRFGELPGVVLSIDTRKMAPHFLLRIDRIDGDVFRFEEELIKIFPTKKTFVRSFQVRMYNSGHDALVVLHHWLLGLGF